MTPAQTLRMFASAVKDGVTMSADSGRYMADQLIGIAAQDERDGHEMRDAAVQMVAEIAALKDCTPDQRADLRRYADLLAKHADRRAPTGSVFDPDENPEPSTVLEFTSWPPARPRGARLQLVAP